MSLWQANEKNNIEFTEHPCKSCGLNAGWGGAGYKHFPVNEFTFEHGVNETRAFHVFTVLSIIMFPQWYVHKEISIIHFSLKNVE